MIRWGILGASGFALKTMAPAILRAQGAQLAAVATRDRQKAAPFADLAPGLCVHHSYDALLADPQIDAVYVPLPNSLHVPWTIRALDAGKPVLCEKPLALRAEDFDDVIAARDRAARPVAEAFMIAHHPQWRMLRDLITEGRIGTLRHVHGVFTYFNDDPANIRNQAALGGGALHDIGIYPIGALRLARPADPICVTHADLRRSGGVDTDAHLSGTLGAASWTAHLSMRAARHQEMSFHGTDGLLHLSAPFNPGSFAEARLDLTCGTHTQSWRFPGADHYVTQIEAFGAQIGGAPAQWPLEMSRETQQVIDSISLLTHEDPSHG